jgi:hypothetical protein
MPHLPHKQIHAGNAKTRQHKHTQKNKKYQQKTAYFAWAMLIPDTIG